MAWGNLTWTDELSAAGESYVRETYADRIRDTDGVYQGPGGPTEDPSGGFQQGGWLAPFFDEALGENMNRTFGECTPWFLAQIDTRPGKSRASLATFE